MTTTGAALSARRFGLYWILLIWLWSGGGSSHPPASREGQHATGRRAVVWYVEATWWRRMTKVWHRWRGGALPRSRPEEAGAVQNNHTLPWWRTPRNRTLLPSSAPSPPHRRLFLWRQDQSGGGDDDQPNHHRTHQQKQHKKKKKRDSQHQQKKKILNMIQGQERVNMTQVMESMASQSQKMKEKKLQFLDHMALMSAFLMRRETNASFLSSFSSTLEPPTESSSSWEDDQAVTPPSDLARPGRHLHIVTTAALPWFTGTAVNPLLRAAHLHRRTLQINNHHQHMSQNHHHQHDDPDGRQNGTNVDNNNNQTTNLSTVNITDGRWVTLVIPWLELREDQEELYGRVFADSQEQEDYIRNWLAQEANMPDVACPETGLDILFYPARYHTGLRSIFAMGDIMNLMEPDKMDVCVLEEPEHINFYRAPGHGWTQRFNYVVGIVHTNYKEYASSHYSGLWSAPAIAMISSAIIRAYCHRVIKLSDTLQSFAPEKEITSNVHGVREDFLIPPTVLPWNTTGADFDNTTQAYFIGKLLWAKGFDIMLDLQDYYKQCTGEYFAIDIYGSGPDQNDIVKAFHGRRRRQEDDKGSEATLKPENECTDADDPNKADLAESALSSNSSDPAKLHIMATTLTIGGGNNEPTMEKELIASLEAIKSKAKEHLSKWKDSFKAVEIPKTLYELRRQPIPANFPGRVDHAVLKNQYKIFINPSISEVLCTTTAEALAMGKFAIIPVHPSNTFFYQFPNCLAYRNKFEFAANLRWALTHDPEPLTTDQARVFTWEAATDRFLNASAVTWKEVRERERLGLTKLDERLAWFHNEISKGVRGDMIRKILGAGPASHQVKYQMEQGVAECLDDFDEDMKSDEAEEECEEEEEDDNEDDADDEEDDDTEDEEDGLSSKFRGSSFAEAIRETIGDYTLFLH